MFTSKTKKSKPKIPTKARLRKIALYYLERFESSEDNLRAVLRRRIDKYAFFDKEYNPEQAYLWVDEIVLECANHNFVNDERFTNLKIGAYLKAGKSKRYIEQKLKQKGIDNKIIDQSFNEIEYSELDVALNFARKKKIGKYRENKDLQLENRQKDLATLVRAGFDFDIAKEIVYSIDDE